MSTESKIEATLESKLECVLPHHLHRIGDTGYIHVEDSTVSCADFVRGVSTPPQTGRACHHHSKRAHVAHQAKWGKWDALRHLQAGLSHHPETGEHLLTMIGRHEVAAAAIAEIPEFFHCCHCGEVFEPKPYPNNDHVAMYCHAILLPGGKMLRADHTPDGNPMEIVRMLCPACVTNSKVIDTAEHDWDRSDHSGKPLVEF